MRYFLLVLILLSCCGADWCGGYRHDNRNIQSSVMYYTPEPINHTIVYGYINENYIIPVVSPVFYYSLPVQQIPIVSYQYVNYYQIRPYQVLIRYNY